MFKKINNWTAILAFGLLAATSSIYNSERALSVSKTLEKTKVKELEDKVDKLSDKMDILIDKLNVEQAFCPTPPSIPSKPIDLNNIQEAVIGSGLFQPDYQFSLSMILFSLVALSAVLNLIFNLFIKDKKELINNKVPKFLVPIYKYYFKINTYTIKYNLIMILISTLLILLLSVYMNYKGIA